MEVDRRENGALIVRANKGVPFYEAKWRDGTGRQRKRRLGRAWLNRSLAAAGGSGAAGSATASSTSGGPIER